MGKLPVFNLLLYFCWGLVNVTLGDKKGKHPGNEHGTLKSMVCRCCYFSFSGV